MPSKKLTDKGEQALADVIAARAEQRRVRAEAEEAARRLIEDAVLDSENTLAEAVTRAVDAGVPKARIGREGMGTLDWPIVNVYVERGRALVA